jgi:hypothetical protein
VTDKNLLVILSVNKHGIINKSSHEPISPGTFH